MSVDETKRRKDMRKEIYERERKGFLSLWIYQFSLKDKSTSTIFFSTYYFILVHFSFFARCLINLGCNCNSFNRMQINNNKIERKFDSKQKELCFFNNFVVHKYLWNFETKTKVKYKYSSINISFRDMVRHQSIYSLSSFKVE